MSRSTDSPSDVLAVEVQSQMSDNLDFASDSDHRDNSCHDSNFSGSQGFSVTLESQPKEDIESPKQAATPNEEADGGGEEGQESVDPQSGATAEIMEHSSGHSSSSAAIPSYHFHRNCNVPARVAGCWSEFEQDNFTKGCKWSPDGLCILTNSNDNCLRLFNLPEQFYSGASPALLSSSSSDESNNALPEMVPVLKMKEGETVYDFCWYPSMTSLDPITCCFVTTSRQNPVHMWDAYSGELRCSYRAYDHLDEMVSASCVAFDLRGEKLFCGFDKMIRIFDVHNPGRCFQERTTKAKGQAGIISCIAFNPLDDKMYAAGSYLKSIGIYMEPKGEQLFCLAGQAGGVTHLMFSQDGTKLFSGGRKDPEILCWDVRNPGKILFSMRRIVLTNQRIYFDLDKSETFLISGNNDGCLSAWDISRVPSEGDDESVLEPILKIQLHDDCISGISFNPVLPIVATSSGQRKFPEPVDDDECESMFTTVSNRDNSLQLWWAGEWPK